VFSHLNNNLAHGFDQEHGWLDVVTICNFLLAQLVSDWTDTNAHMEKLAYVIRSCARSKSMFTVKYGNRIARTVPWATESDG